MKYLIISGSSRQDSQSKKVADFLLGRFPAVVGGNHEVSIFSLAENPLPLWDENFAARAGLWSELWPPIEARFKAADAFVFIVPEWNGMVPPAVKNLIFLAGRTLAHKPALITTVSSGMGGAYVVSELRSSAYKNNSVVFLPEQLVLRNIGTLLNGAAPSGDVDTSVRERIDHDLVLLKLYAEALMTVRQSKEIDLNKYPNGM